ERFTAIAQFASRDLGAQPVFVAGPESQRSIADWPVLNDLTLPELAAVIASSQVLISNDTGPMHLGPALGVPTLGLFSVGLPEHYRPLGTHSRFLRSENIQNIRVEDVIEQVRQMWEQTPLLS